MYQANKRTTDLIKAARINQGLSQTAVSELIGHSNGQFISNVERYTCNYSFDHIKILTKHFKIPQMKVHKSLLRDYEEKVLRKVWN